MEQKNKTLVKVFSAENFPEDDKFQYQYPTQYSVVKVETVKNGPKIEVRETIVNASNIKLYRNGNILFIAGFLEKDDIIIYRYKISDNLKLNLNINFDRSLINWNNNKDGEKKTIAHEKKHWENNKFALKEDMAVNLEELALSYAWDEISAFTAANLYKESNINKDTLYYSFLLGTHDFLNRQCFYLNLHFDTVSRIAFKRKAFGCLVYTDITSIDNNYSESFKRLIKEYLTFNGVSCYEIKNSRYAKEVNHNISIITHNYRKLILKLTRLLCI